MRHRATMSARGSQLPHGGARPGDSSAAAGQFRFEPGRASIDAGGWRPAAPRLA